MAVRERSVRRGQGERPPGAWLRGFRRTRQTLASSSLSERPEDHSGMLCRIASMPFWRGGGGATYRGRQAEAPHHDARRSYRKSGVRIVARQGDNPHVLLPCESIGSGWVNVIVDGVL